MARPLRVIPEKAEFQAVLLDMSAKFYADRWAPGVSTWNTYKPKGWPDGPTMARRFKPGDPFDPPNWAATVTALIGREVAPPNSRTRKKKNVEHEDPFERVDDYPHRDSQVVGDAVRAYSIPTGRGTFAVHYVLR